MNLSLKILSFFIRQEMGNSSTCTLRNKMCVTIINDYVQLPSAGKNSQQRHTVYQEQLSWEKCDIDSIAIVYF